MATPFLEKLEEEFLCCICSDELKDPVGLPCLHGFCFKCLEECHKSRPDKARVECPICRQTFPKPKGGIRGFPKHFMIKNLQEKVQQEKKVFILTTLDV